MIDASRTRDEVRLQQAEVPAFDMAWVIPGGNDNSPLAELTRNLCDVYGIDEWMAFACVFAACSGLVNANGMLEVGMPGKTIKFPGTMWTGLCAPSGGCKTAIMHALTANIMCREPAYFVRDENAERVVTTACENPGGVTWLCDDFRAFCASPWAHDMLLSALNGEPVTIRRATSRKVVHVNACYIGAIVELRPKELRQFAEENGEMLRRFLLVQGRSNDAMPMHETSLRHDLIDKITGGILDAIPHRNRHADGSEDKPVVFHMEDEATRMLYDAIGTLRKRAHAMHDDVNTEIFALNRHYENILPRFLLVLHCMENPKNLMISADTTRRGLLLFEALKSMHNG